MATTELDPALIVGRTFGFLTVVGLEPPSKHRYALCRCICGIRRRVAWNNLRRGFAISCGCQRRSPVRSPEDAA